MTARNPLFEFMPYGAPELIAAQRPNLLRALVLASGIALVAFVLARALGLAVPAPVSIDLPPLQFDPMRIEAPPSIRVTEPVTPRIAVRARANAWSIPVPVPDPIAPHAPVAQPASTGPVDGVEGGAIDAPEAHPGPAIGLTVDDTPELGKYVYTDEMPAAVKIVEPKYPDLAKEIGIEGRVYVHMLVGRDGRVTRVEIDPKFSVPMLDESALVAARQWVFKPALVNQHPIPVWVGEMFVYRLH